MIHPKKKATAQTARVTSAATDGACSGNPGPGGWGVLIHFEDGRTEEFGGYEAKTTNNRMELQAALELLKRLRNLPRHPSLLIKTDSKYLIQGFNEWINTWKKKGWRTAAGKPVLNKDLWQELDKARLTDIRLEYVKGHSGDPDNDRVDEIAVSFSKENFIKLHSAEELTSSPLSKSNFIEDNYNDLKEPCSPELNALLTKLDVANHLAKKGYGLTLNELSELVNEPIAKLVRKRKSWRWRNWTVEPIANSLWKLTIADATEVKEEENEE